MSRVFIVGAGCSHEDTKSEIWPLPLATQFLSPRAFDEYYSFGKRDGALANVLKDYFGYTPDGLQTNIPNVEEIFSFLEESISALLHSARARNLVEARQELWQLVYNFFSVSGTENRYEPLKLETYRLSKSIAYALSYSDSIITFNWDLIFDYLLRGTVMGREMLVRQARMIDPSGSYDRTNLSFYNYTSQFNEDGYFLKMHGSFNLAYCKNAQCRNHTYPWRLIEGESELLYERYCWECSSPIEILITPPFVGKSYAHHRLLKLQANQAIEKLRFAEEIIAVGYSFPAYDLNAQSMFRLARGWRYISGDTNRDKLKRLILVNPEVNNPTYVDRVLDILRARRLGKESILLFDTADAFLEFLASNDGHLPPMRD